MKTRTAIRVLCKDLAGNTTLKTPKTSAQSRPLINILRMMEGKVGLSRSQVTKRNTNQRTNITQETLLPLRHHLRRVKTSIDMILRIFAMIVTHSFRREMVTQPSGKTQVDDTLGNLRMSSLMTTG